MTMPSQPPPPPPPNSNDRDEREPSAKKRRKRTWPGFFRDVFFYVLIYVALAGFSIGPCFWNWYGAVYADGPKWIARFYMPLLVLCELVPPLSWLINLWVNWWIL